MDFCPPVSELSWSSFSDDEVYDPWLVDEVGLWHDYEEPGGFFCDEPPGSAPRPEQGLHRVRASLTGMIVGAVLFALAVSGALYASRLPLTRPWWGPGGAFNGPPSQARMPMVPPPSQPAQP